MIYRENCFKSKSYYKILIGTKYQQKKYTIIAIQYLMTRDTLLTSAIVKNFTKKIHKGWLEKYWTMQFLYCYKIYLKIIYLQNIDS